MPCFWKQVSHAKNKEWIQRADHFRQQFEELLADVVKISNGRVNAPIQT